MRLAVVNVVAAGYIEKMSIIVSEVYDALLEAGASEAKAKAAAAAIPVGEHLATREDIAASKAEIAGLKVAMFTFGPLIPGLSVKLVFFPWPYGTARLLHRLLFGLVQLDAVYRASRLCQTRITTTVSSWTR